MIGQLQKNKLGMLLVLPFFFREYSPRDHALGKVPTKASFAVRDILTSVHWRKPICL